MNGGAIRGKRPQDQTVFLSVIKIAKNIFVLGLLPGGERGTALNPAVDRAARSQLVADALQKYGIYITITDAAIGNVSQEPNFPGPEVPSSEGNKGQRMSLDPAYQG